LRRLIESGALVVRGPAVAVMVPRPGVVLVKVVVVAVGGWKLPRLGGVTDQLGVTGTGLL
jgi:hypothetical protein